MEYLNRFRTYYKLIDRKIVKTLNFVDWALWYETADRHINLTKIKNNIKISTVFLGIDHGYFEKEPILFETMVFGGKYDQLQQRYITIDQAETGHEKIVKLCKSEFIHLPEKEQKINYV